MKKIITTLLALIVLQTINAQRTIDGLIKAEKEFAAYSVANSTKEAFLKFLDSNGLVFDKGKAVNGIESWNKREKRPGILNWWPAFTEISKSNDFGYTSGPWTFQASANDTVVARGQYTTVWHINKNGEWKFLIDLGVSNTPPDTNTHVWNRTYPALRRGSLKSLIKREKEFIKASADSAWGPYTIRKNDKLYLNAITGTSLLNRNGMEPQSGSWKKGTFPENVQYAILGSGIASSGDLGYIYGSIVINEKTDNYLRIWRKTRDGWKIAVEVLRY